MGEIILREEFARAGIDEHGLVSGAGNIRDAAGVREFAGSAAIDGVRVRSAGVSDEEHGNGIDHRARKVLDEAGYRKGRVGVAHRVTAQELLGSDLILAMTASHRASLIRMAKQVGADPSKIRMWRETDVPDPWYGDLSDFYDTLDVIQTGAKKLVDELMRS
ncbi:MAG: low molecular weight phosphotyrosine protein phosphatase [Arcanobacterium sp.]|nr:low molecular weight phosphotyrosine protein phosphatase [Arcanobacterium sp.]